MGRRQVVRHLVLVQAFQRFESFRPSTFKESPKRLSFIVFQSSSVEILNKYVNIYIGKRPQEVVTLKVFLNSLLDEVKCYDYQ